MTNDDFSAVSHDSNRISIDVEWQPPMPHIDLIFDNGEPLESNRYRIAMNTLIRSLKHG